MTYCCGILVRDGLVMFADTRTNAGVDNISTFRKLHVFVQAGERIMAIATAGNLSISQSVVSMLREGWENSATGETETLMNSPTMFQAAQRIGRAVAQSGFMGSIPYAEMQPIYAKLKATPHPWRTIELPWRTRAP